MTIREYICKKLPAFELTDVDFADLTIDDVDAEYSDYKNSKEVGMAMIQLIEELSFRPHLKNINESGFSASWEYDLSKLYMLLCKRYGVEPDTDVLGLLGVNTITIRDLSDYL